MQSHHIPVRYWLFLYRAIDLLKVVLYTIVFCIYTYKRILLSLLKYWKFRHYVHSICIHKTFEVIFHSTFVRRHIFLIPANLVCINWTCWIIFRMYISMINKYTETTEILLSLKYSTKAFFDILGIFKKSKTREIFKKSKTRLKTRACPAWNDLKCELYTRRNMTKYNHSPSKKPLLKQSRN